MPPFTGCEVFLVLNPTGPVNTMFTFIGTFTSELNSTCTMQVSVPLGCMGVGVLADNITEVGAGTAVMII